MNRKSKEFHVDDIVFANLVKCGEEIVSVKLTGIKSMADIISYIKTLIGNNLGQAVMKIRNFSQGWAMERPVLFRAPAVPQGLQLTLF